MTLQTRGAASVDALQELNPTVKVALVTENVEEQPDGFFAQYDAIIFTQGSEKLQRRVSRVCHVNKRALFAAQMHGLLGGFFVDMGESFDYVMLSGLPPYPSLRLLSTEFFECNHSERASKTEGQPPTRTEEKVHFCAYDDALQVPLGSVNRLTKGMAALRGDVSLFFRSLSFTFPHLALWRSL